MVNCKVYSVLSKLKSSEDTGSVRFLILATVSVTEREWVLKASQQVQHFRYHRRRNSWLPGKVQHRVEVSEMTSPTSKVHREGKKVKAPATLVIYGASGVN